MQATRRLRLQAVIQEELSMVVPREVKDPRIPLVTFTQVEVTPDGSQATVYVSILGAGTVLEGQTEEQAQKQAQQEMKSCLEGLTSASGFLKRHLARVLNIRHIPNLIFKEDRGLANTLRVHELLKKISTEES